MCAYRKWIFFVRVLVEVFRLYSHTVGPTNLFYPISKPLCATLPLLRATSGSFCATLLVLLSTF